MFITIIKTNLGSQLSAVIKRIATTFLLLYFVLNPITAFPQPDSLDYSLSSPYQTILTHLKYLQEDSYYPEISAEAFSVEDIDQKKAEELAIKWKQVLDGRGIFIYLDEVPVNPNYFDSALNRQRYIPVQAYPDIFLEKVGDEWLYVSKGFNLIDKLHKETFPFGTFEKLGGSRYFGLYLWQYIGILILVTASFLIHRSFTFLIDKLITRLLFNAGYKEIAKKYIAPVARPISIFIILFLLKLLIPLLILPIKASQYINISINALMPFIATLVFYRMVDLLSLYFEKAAAKTESTLDDQLVPLFRKTLKTFVVIIGGIFVLQNLEIEVMPLLAGLSIGGLAFALAAQDTVKNFFGSLMIFIDKPFQVGDWITQGEIDGTVEEVGMRSTRVRTFRNSVVYVPNGMLANASIDNHGLRVYRRFYTKLALTYDTPPDLIELFIEGLHQIVKDHPFTRKDYFEIHMNDMASHSLDVMFYIFFKVPSWSDELRCRHEVILSVLKLAEEIGVNFAFPTQTLHMENFPGQVSLSPGYKDVTTLEPKMKAFLEKNKQKFGDNS